MGECPCCGQSIMDSPLKVSMEFNTIICGSTALEVTPKECEITFVLHKAWPHGVSQSRLISQVWGHAAIEEPTIRNTVYTARKKLNTIGYTIRALRSRGYRLEKLGQLTKKEAAQ